MKVQHDDVAMKMFVQTLEGEACAWYKALPNASIDGWNSFRDKFTERWIDKQDNSLLKSFTNLKKENDTMNEFNAHFSKVDHRIHASIRPNVAMALIYYLETFDGLFGILLKGKDPQTLDVAFVTALKAEKHIMEAKAEPVPSSTLFDPQARRTQDPSTQALHIPKEEIEADIGTKLLGLMSDFSNRLVKVEKNTQTQQNLFPNQRQFPPKKPFQQAMMPKE